MIIPKSESENENFGSRYCSSSKIVCKCFRATDEIRCENVCPALFPIFQCVANLTMVKTVSLNGKIRVVDVPKYEDVVWSVRRTESLYLGIVESFYRRKH